MDFFSVLFAFRLSFASVFAILFLLSYKIMQPTLDLPLALHSQDILENRAAALIERNVIPYMYLRDPQMARENLYLSESVSS